MFDSKIKEIRLKRGMTQEELSNMTEISQSYISKIENKNYKLLSNDKTNALLQIAKALGCCPAELYRISCKNCEIRTTNKERINCRNAMIAKGYNPRSLILE